MQETIREYISEQIRGNCFENIFIRTKMIKKICPEANNTIIFNHLLNLERDNIIRIKQIARAKKHYKDRENWLPWTQRMSRYLIDILQPEYFGISHVSETNWAIKAYVDTQDWNFVLQFNGIDEDIRIDLKPAKGGEKTKIMDFWERVQNNTNEWCECPFAKPHTSISTFFGRFCKELQPYLIELKKGGYEARFTPVIYSQVLMAKGVKEFVFFGGTDIDVHYKCKFDENGEFIGWHKY